LHRIRSERFIPISHGSKSVLVNGDVALKIAGKFAAQVFSGQLQPGIFSSITHQSCSSARLRFMHQFTTASETVFAGLPLDVFQTISLLQSHCLQRRRMPLRLGFFLPLPSAI